ncbi:hypothetical protein OE165_28360, partial [Escherichia coli]|uniref:hypothetical protein n=1 Tax=Escherichia coli TaxID=562 RepID=UPI0021F3337A
MSASPSAAIEIPIDLAIPDSVVNYAGLLPGAGSKSLQLFGNAGGVASIMDSAGATQAISTIGNTVSIQRINPRKVSR